MFNEKIFALYSNIVITPSFIKYRKEDKDNIIIIMNEDLNIFYISDTARVIFEIILSRNKCTIMDIYQKLKLMYDVNSEIIKNDLVNFIKEMHWNKIITLLSK